MSIQKLLEEESKLCKECCGGCYHLNKDILKVVIPLLRELAYKDDMGFVTSVEVHYFIDRLESLTSSSDKEVEK